MEETAYQTRLQRILGVPLAEGAARQWPQSGELIRGRARIAEMDKYGQSAAPIPALRRGLSFSNLTFGKEFTKSGFLFVGKIRFD